MIKFDKDLEKLKLVLKNSKSLSLDEITKVLNWSPKFRKENRTKLENWISQGELVINKKNRYNLPENVGLKKGIFSNISGRFGFVDTEEESYFIPRNRFNSALDGDTVLISETATIRENGKKEAEIKFIISRKKNIITGIFQKKESFGFVIPTESFGRDIYIPKQFFNKAQNDELVALKITFWGDEKRKPEGKIVERIGTPFDSDNMIKALILREEVSDEFSPESSICYYN